MDSNLRRELILDGYQNPYNKKEIKNDDSYIKISTKNDSCIDDLDIYFKIEDDKIKDIYFWGEACAISTSATSLMIRKLIGKTIKDAKILLENYVNMINEKPYDKNLLEELNCFDEIYLKPNRKGCALLPAMSAERLIKSLENEN